MDFKDFTILCVEDNKLILKVYKNLFTYMFKEVYFAENGKDGLETFKQKHPDIVLTDEVMPEMNGLEMVKEIREIDKDVPIILVSAFDNKDMLIKAIDLNITAFVKKPVTKDNLVAALEKAAKYSLANKILFKNLRATIDYKNYQEKLALEKEKKIIKVEKNIIEPFEVDVFYKPLEITSGDSYSVRRDCLFLVDAMGKGVSASITAMLTTAFYNYLVDKGDYFQDIVNETALFMKRNLLDYEVLSFGVYKIKNNRLDFSSFSLPTIFIQRDGKIERVPSNNPPLNPMLDNINFSSVNLDGVEKILIGSDGLTEATTKDNKLYLRYLEEDFLNSSSIDEFESKRKERVTMQEDDITYFFLKRIKN